MAIIEIVGGSDRPSLIKRFERKSKHDAVSELVDFHLLNCTRIEKLEAEAQALREQLEALRARVVVVHEPVTMDGKTTIREYVANAAPADLPMDAWTQGYEECKRRIHAMFEQPCNKRLNGKAVSEGLLRRIHEHLRKYVFAPFGEPLPPEHSERSELAEELSELLGEGNEVGDAEP